MANKTQYPVLSPSKISKLASDRFGEQSGRIDKYKTAMRSYEGETENLHSIVANYADGRPAMRELATVHDDRMGRRGAPNFVYAAVRDLSAIYGVDPETKVLAEGPEKDQQDMAVKRTRILREQWTHSRMSTQMSQMGFHLTTFGDHVFTIDVLTPSESKSENDPSRPPGIYYNGVSPMICYPSFIGGRNSRKLDDLIIRDYFSVGEVNRRWPGKYRSTGKDDTEKILIATYYGPAQRTVVAVNEELKLEEYVHNLGYCPAVWVCKEINGDRLAQGDVSKAVDLNDCLRSLWFLLLDTLQWAALPIIVTIGGQQSFGGQRLEVGPGSSISVGPGGDVKVVAPMGNAQIIEMALQTAQDQLLKIIGISPIRINNQIDRSNVSARSVNQQQAPMQSRVNQGYVIIGDSLELMNTITMRMLSDIPELASTEMSLYGAEEDGSLGEDDTYSGKDMGGWTRNTVKWDSFIGSDNTEKLHNALLLYQANPKGFPWRRVLEEAGEENAADLIKEAMEAIAEFAGPGPGGPGGPPGPGGAQTPSAPPSPSGGPQPGPGEGPPPGGAPTGPASPAPAQLPPFPPTDIPPGASPYGGPGVVPDIIGMLKQAISSVKLFGQITVEPHLEPGKVVASVSDFRDKKPVKDALTPVAKEINPKYTVDVNIEKPAKAGKGK